MAKFRFIHWLVGFLNSQSFFSFEWDQGNSSKNREKHGVSIEMIESVFQDEKFCILGQQYHPIVLEQRYGVIGKNYNGDILFVCFTIRNG